MAKNTHESLNNVISNEHDHVVKSGKKLRLGFTTGTCAAAATKAATIMLLTQQAINNILIDLPNGKKLNLVVEDIMINAEKTSCSIVKDSGDDPDVTDRIKIYAKVTKTEIGIKIDGGIGIGRITQEGLPCMVGEAAINPVPMKMIKKVLLEIISLYNYVGGLKVEIYAPEGKEIAKKTFNERLGIVGGISILGTTGIVEPMSESAIISSIKMELDLKKKNGQKVLFIAPGNYGIAFAKEHLKIDLNKAVKCSNFIGETLDYATYLKFEKLLLISHIGKIVKIAAGVMNTHSKIADCRNEVFASHCALIGINKYIIEKVMSAKTTKEIHDILLNQKLEKQVYRSILVKILYHLNYRVRNKIEIGVVGFNNEDGLIMQTDNVRELIDILNNEHIINN